METAHVSLSRYVNGEVCVNPSDEVHLSAEEIGYLIRSFLTFRLERIGCMRHLQR